MEGEHNKIIERYLPLLISVPYTREIYLSGSLARKQSHSESDIDLVVISKENRIWFNRILLNLVTFLIGKRRSQHQRAGCFCFNSSFGENNFKKINKKDFWISLNNKFPNSRFLVLRRVLEFLLEITFLGLLFEKISKIFLSNYIYKKFRNFKDNKKAVLLLRRNEITYHPPKLIL